MREYFCRVSQPVYRPGVVIYIGFTDKEETYILYGNEYKKVKEGDDIPPSLALEGFNITENSILTNLVDGLLSAGARPTKPVDNPSELRATQYHLEDMRKLAFLTAQKETQ